MWSPSTEMSGSSLYQRVRRLLCHATAGKLSSRVKKIFKIGCLSLILLLVVREGYLLRKFSRPPKRPTNLPRDAVWVDAPATPFEMSYRGMWLACWRLEGIGVQCAMTDWDGTPKYGDLYLPSDDPKRPVPDGDLHLKNNMTWTDVWAGFVDDSHEGHEIPAIYLENGTILLPATNYDTAKKYLEDRAHNK